MLSSFLTFCIENTGFVVLTIALAFLIEGLTDVLVPKKIIRLSRKIHRKIRLRRAETPDSAIPRRTVWFKILSGFLYTAWGIMWLAIIRPSVTKLPDPVMPGSSCVIIASEIEAKQPDLKTTIADLVNAHIDSNPMGMVVGVITNQCTATFGYGRIRIDDPSPPDGDTLFEIGSVTKVFTATALSAMDLNGNLDLDNPLRQVLPPQIAIPPADGQEITLLDLATHTSGLPRVPFSLMRVGDVVFLDCLYNPYAHMSEERCINYLRRRGLDRPSSRSFSYSNFGAGLLGYALAKANGTTYEKLVTSKICVPLGMKDTIITLSEDQTARMASGYCGNFAIAGLCFYLPCNPWTCTECTQGAGALRSTANDLLKFLAANLGLLKTDLQPVLEHGQTAQANISERAQIALGWIISERKDGPVFWHNGGTGGYRSFLAFSKTHRVGVVVLASSTKLVDNIGLSILTDLCRLQDSTSSPS